MLRIARLAAPTIAVLTAVIAQETKPTPPAEYQALQREFQQAARGLYTATNDAERHAVTEAMADLSPRVFAWAESHATDPFALEGLVQVVTQEIWLQNNTRHPGRGTGSLEARAIGLLLAHHAASPALGEACKRMCFGFHRECERFLRELLAASPHREVRGQACLRLAQFLIGRLRRLDLLRAQPGLAVRYEGLFGTAYLQQLAQQDRAAVVQEAESLFARAAAEFPEIRMTYGELVGATARAELHALRNLAIGKQAPELAGTAQDGRLLRLSDQRGKVVLLYFWSQH